MKPAPVNYITPAMVRAMSKPPYPFIYPRWLWKPGKDTIREISPQHYTK